MRRPALLVALLVSVGPVALAQDIWRDPPPPPRPRPAIQWRASLDEAKQEAIRGGRLLLVADVLQPATQWSDNLTELVSGRFVCVRARERWIEEDKGLPRHDAVLSGRMYLCTSDGYVLDALDGSWPSDAIEQEARWTLDAVASLTRSGIQVGRGEAADALSRMHSDEATRLSQNDASSPRIAFHQAQARSPLADVATLLRPWTPPPPRHG